ncbi:MAG: tRNA (N(6)-L-threonylcarbamoyladenosine(37)-C(2))-methylthiotransferase MtaB [Huintestinicola sp.]|uniref:tRNA (N(6)-L-threonylcarbamoyladenosine(37)-C(2))- methylthiotransferase MtaB n=1 Tax=Huintestinicola sp. TaxID=2981661 RepID=UPI003F1033B8
MYIHFITFGCKVNTYETACMTAAFEAEGFTPTVEKKLADIFVINSCTVTSESDSKLRQTLRGLRRDHPNAVIVLTGCFPQAFPEEAAAEGCADIVTGTKNRSDIVRLVKEYLEDRKRVCSVAPYSPHDSFEAMSAEHLEGHTRAFMKIQDGCNAFCTYCIIPYSRGRIRSKPLSDIVSEAKRLAANGYREIVLVGINLAFYGAELGIGLADAVEAISGIKGIDRIRLGSLEPEKMTNDVLNRLAAVPEFCPSFHLSLQSGCDRTLKAMNRRYTADEYAALVQRIRSIFPDCGITADVMAGFPGETEEDHRESVEFIRKIGFSDIHVFPYSRRKGTKADLMEGQVQSDIKKRRARELASAGAECRRKFLQSLVGKEFPVLFEREKSDGVHHGYAPNYAHIKILTKNSEKSLRKMIFYVKIDKIGDNCCFGEIIQNGGDLDTNIQ